MAELYKTTSGRKYHAGSIAIVTVGLPARGKTFTARRLARYLRWLGVKTAIFNVGHYRRNWMGCRLPVNFFDPSIEKYAEVRLRIADAALTDLIRWLNEGLGQVAIYDAANTTEERRQDVLTRLAKEHIHVIFLETICDKPEQVDSNIREIKVNSPDYTGMASDEAIRDFLKRISWYQSSYTILKDPSLSYIQLINAGEHIIVNQIKGYLQTRMVYFLANLHINPRKIYFARHGESTLTNEYKVDPVLTENGMSYTNQLKKFIAEQEARNARPLQVWTSFRKRSKGTLKILDHPNSIQKMQLAELNRGVIDGLSDMEIQKRFPQEYIRNIKDTYRHRYPRGESYLDVAVRLETVILELEKCRGDVLIIAHETVLRCLYAYFADRPENEIPFLSFPRHIVMEITPLAYGFRESRYFIYPFVLQDSDEAYTTIYQNEFSLYHDLQQGLMMANSKKV